MKRSPRLGALVFLLPGVLATPPAGAAQRFTLPQFESGYQLPTVVNPGPRRQWELALDVLVMAAALSAAAVLLHHSRRRNGVQALAIFCLAYFGFYRGGCVCPIGAIQNVAWGLADPGYSVSLVVIAIFALPLLFALLYGRVYCGAVCPLGAIQDVMLLRPLALPPWLDHALGLLRWVYLGGAVLFAATGTLFIICQYDPFVSFFRFAGSFSLFVLGFSFLVLATFVGRPYCRYFCPYGALLSLPARVARRGVRTTPDECVVCGLCGEACPFGAIQPPQKEPGPTAGAAWFLFPVLLTVLGGFGGYCASPALARAHDTVSAAALAYKADMQDTAGVRQLSAELHDRLRVNEVLFRQARQVERTFLLGGALFGAWCGLVLGLKLLALTRAPRRAEYEPDGAFCFSCGRCYLSCPRERVRREGKPGRRYPPPGANPKSS